MGFFDRFTSQSASNSGGQGQGAAPLVDVNSLPLPNASGLNRLHATFTGRCQGVGFRYTAASIADSLGLSGWVRNHMDGSVELEIQGSSSGIRRFMQKLFAAYARYRFAFQIAKATAEDPIPGETGFKVRY